jgi:acetyl-CoA carboxylase biotin carboxyl carrier protein
VPDEKQDTPRPFDVKTVEYLLRLMSEHELSEIDLKEADQRIRLRKGSTFPTHFAPVPVAPAHPGHPVPPATAGPALTHPPAKKYHEIKSEFPGTFYTRPLPDKPEFVTVGSRVTPDTTVCIVMAMKVNNEIKAAVAGTIAEVCLPNESGVEYGTVLFRVDPG